MANSIKKDRFGKETATKKQTIKLIKDCGKVFIYTDLKTYTKISKIEATRAVESISGLFLLEVSITGSGKDFSLYLSKGKMRKPAKK